MYYSLSEYVFGKQWRANKTREKQKELQIKRKYGVDAIETKEKQKETGFMGRYLARLKFL